MPPSSLVRRLLLGILCASLLLFAGACCPPKVVGYGTPAETLRTWQSQLCHDDPIEEYGCLSAGLKQEMAGYETYFAARRKLLAEEPLFAWLLRRVDLPERAVEVSIDEEEGRARMAFEAQGERFEVHFVRETWVVFDTDDDPSPTARLERSPSEIVYQRGRSQTLLVDRPFLTSEQIRSLRGLRLETRWKIDALAGLQVHPRVTP